MNGELNKTIEFYNVLATVNLVKKVGAVNAKLVNKDGKLNLEAIIGQLDTFNVQESDVAGNENKEKKQSGFRKLLSIFKDSPPPSRPVELKKEERKDTVKSNEDDGFGLIGGNARRRTIENIK